MSEGEEEKEVKSDVQMSGIRHWVMKDMPYDIEHRLYGSVINTAMVAGAIEMDRHT